ncbi:MAG: type II toxin-antitoxin system RelE/ParE family toxin [Syntrophomonadaceae bacterium]
MKIEFIETSFFTKQLAQLLTDEEYRRLQSELIENPDKGRLIVGGLGIRKIRAAYAGKDKSGGARAIYYFKKDDRRIYMLLIYPKSEQENLTPEQLEILTELVRRELK